jgi:hypothetical protein
LTSVYQQTEVEAISRALEETVFATHNVETKPRSESLSSWQDVQLHDDFYDISEDFVSSEGGIKEKRVMKEEAMRKHANCTWDPDFGHFDAGIQRLAVRYAIFGGFINKSQYDRI